MSFGVSLDMRPLIKIKQQFAPAVTRAVDRTLAQAKASAQEWAHVDSEAMREGTYTATREKSGYDEAVSAAKAKDPDVVILPEVAAPPEGGGVLSNVTQQSIFEEFGTSKHGPHPFLTPAAIEAEEFFVDNLETELRRVLR